MPEQLSWFKLSAAALAALARRELDSASAATGIQLTPYFITDEAVWLWAYRLRQAEQDARVLDWIAQVVALEERAIGHAGFHGPPDEAGMVEVAYSVDESYRRKGYGKSMLRHLLERAALEPAVKTVRASIQPTNLISLALIKAFPFRQVGQQWDDIDGLELVFEATV